MTHEVKTETVMEVQRAWPPLNVKWPGKIDPVHCSVAGGRILEQGRPRHKFYLDSSWVILWASISVLTTSYISWWIDTCVQFLNIVNNLRSSLFFNCKATNPGFTHNHFPYWAPHSRPLSTCPNYTGACWQTARDRESDMIEVIYAPEPAAIIQNSQSQAAYLAMPIAFSGIHSTGFLPSSPGYLCLPQNPAASPGGPVCLLFLGNCDYDKYIYN